MEYAKARPRQRMLYIAFNKGIQLEAERKFPKNVMCRTSHSLAYRKFGSRYRHKRIQGLKAKLVKNALDLMSYEDARFTIDTVLSFLASSDPDISKYHIPKAAQACYKHRRNFAPGLIDSGKTLWARMYDTNDLAVGQVHDGYLKLYQLSEPELYFDCILVDEAQDLNPVTAHFALNQKTRRIVVGDSHQQIYSFRGAVDIMRPVQPAHTLYLTRSFRFGKQIAMVANMVLGHFKGETHKIKGTEPPEGEPKNQKDGRYTIIARTNASIFREAIRRHRTKKIGFVGGIQGYRFQTIEDAYWLFENQPNRITDPYIRSFLRFSGMKEYAQVVEDLELRSVCAVVEEYNHQIPDLVAKIRAAAVDTPMADVCLTKAHKAKGLEWDTVFLTDDYIALMGENGKPIDPRTKAPDEFNLVYVAATRARKTLRIPPEGSLKAFIRWSIKTRKKGIGIKS